MIFVQNCIVAHFEFTCVKVKNFQNPKLSKFKFLNLQEGRLQKLIISCLNVFL